MTAPDEIEQRYLEGIPHDPRSVVMAESLAAIDWENGDMLDLRFGADDDQGETLMYILDIHFAREDAGTK